MHLSPLCWLLLTKQPIGKTRSTQAVLNTLGRPPHAMRSYARTGALLVAACRGHEAPRTAVHTPYSPCETNPIRQCPVGRITDIAARPKQPDST